MKLPSALEMKKLDHSAIHDFGIPGIVLMENAGLGTVQMMEKELGPPAGTFVLIFVGPGNNGGDGLVIGRHLHQRGCQPVFFFLVSLDTLKGDAAVNLNIVQKLRLPFHVIDNSTKVATIPILIKQFETEGLPCYAVVDAIFGIGLNKKVSDHYADTIKLLNQADFAHKSPVISVDTPSGLDADTGNIFGICVQADYTATYGCAKPGHFIHEGSFLTGKLDIIDIGIPPETVQNANITTECSTSENFKTISRQLNRKSVAHKGTQGHLLILAGSTGKTGAGILAAKGAQRSGAGLVSLCVPQDLNTIFETSLAETMTIPLPNSTSSLSHDDWEMIMESATNKHAVVIGPGIGTAPGTARLVMRLYQSLECPLVLDADALNILATHRGALHNPAGPRIFTPHPGEMSRLLDSPITEIQNNRLEAATKGCDLVSNKNHDTVMVLKGAGTIIASGNGSTVINTTGNPGMAAGGMGDVLSGVIGALIGQGMTAKDAAIAGVYLHGYAADMLYEKNGPGFSATEVADMIPFALKIHFTA